MKHKGTIELHSKRLILRRFTINDAEKMYKNWASDERVTRYLTRKPHKNIDITKEYIKELIANYNCKDFYNRIVTLNNEPIGAINLMNINDNLGEAEIGYCYGFNYRHQGYATEALQTVINFAFNDINLNRLTAFHQIENINSGKVMEKCGMTKRSVEHKTINNKEITIVSYQIFNNK